MGPSSSSPILNPSLYNINYAKVNAYSNHIHYQNAMWVCYYVDVRSEVKVTWRNSTTSIEFLDMQEYYAFKSLLTIIKLIPSATPTPTPAPTPTPTPAPALSLDNQKIAQLETQVAELSSLNTSSQVEIENLTNTLIEALNQPPPAAPAPPPIPPEMLQKLKQTNSMLGEWQSAFRQQCESLQAGMQAIFTSGQQIETLRMNYEDIVDGVSSSPSSSSTVSHFDHILREARQQYTLQVDSHDPTRVDLARSYYSVFYDLVCKENAVLGRACVSPTVMEEAKARLEVLNRNQDQERMNFLHQLQNMHVVKEAIYEAEQQIRRNAEQLQENLRNLEIRRAYEHMLSHVKRTRELFSAAPVKCFISYAWPRAQQEREKLQVKLRQIRDDLQEAGLEVLLDLANMQGNVSNYMEQGINSANKVILICTPRLVERAAEASNNIVTELKCALQRQCNVPSFIVPILLEGSATTAIPRTIGGQSNDGVANLLFLKFVDESYENVMVRLEPLGLIPMILGLGDIRNSAQRAAYSAAFDRYTLQKQQIRSTNNNDNNRQ